MLIVLIVLIVLIITIANMWRIMAHNANTKIFFINY